MMAVGWSFQGMCEGVEYEDVSVGYFMVQICEKGPRGYLYLFQVDLPQRERERESSALMYHHQFPSNERDFAAGKRWIKGAMLRGAATVTALQGGEHSKKGKREAGGDYGDDYKLIESKKRVIVQTKRFSAKRFHGIRAGSSRLRSD